MHRTRANAMDDLNCRSEGRRVRERGTKTTKEIKRSNSAVNRERENATTGTVMVKRVHPSEGLLRLIIPPHAPADSDKHNSMQLLISYDY